MEVPTLALALGTLAENAWLVLVVAPFFSKASIFFSLNLLWLSPSTSLLFSLLPSSSIASTSPGRRISGYVGILYLCVEMRVGQRDETVDNSLSSYRYVS